MKEVITFGGVALLAVAALLVGSHPANIACASSVSKPATPHVSKNNSAAPSIPENSASLKSGSSPESLSQRAIEPKRIDESKPQIIKTLETASTMYSPQAIPILTPYLTNSDPEIREAALDAFLRLDEPGSIPVLRSVAATMNDKAESKRLLDAANFLSLPPYKPTNKKSAVATTQRSPVSQRNH